MACLALVDEADFVFLQAQTGMTGGNVSSHLKKLDAAGYVSIQKQFVDSRPRTTLKLTELGRNALTDYVATIQHLISVLPGREEDA